MVGNVKERECAFLAWTELARILITENEQAYSKLCVSPLLSQVVLESLTGVRVGAPRSGVRTSFIYCMNSLQGL